MVTKAQVINWAKGLANRHTGYDADGVYGWQCVDIPNGASKIFFGRSLLGNGIDMLNAARGAGYRVETSGLPKAGAFFCARVPSHPYGHTGIVIEDATSPNNIKTIEQNVSGGSITAGGPATYLTRSLSSPYLTIIGWFYPPYSDLNQSYTDNQNGQTVKVKYTAKSISYGGHTISAENVGKILRYAANRVLLPSGLFSQLYYESNFGDSNVGRLDNNWSGMTGGAQTRPSGVVVTTGSARPPTEGGTYMHYASTDDFFNDWTYTLYKGGYKVSGVKDFEGYVRGLFREGGATYNYAATPYNQYASIMRSVRSGMNRDNKNVLDEMDQAFKDGNLLTNVGSTNDMEKIWETDSMNFLFRIINDPNWNAGTVYYYNGDINSIQTVHNPEELKYIQQIYKETTGRDLKYYTWDSSVAPVQIRIFGTLQPGAPNATVKAEIDKLIAQLNSEI